MNTENLSTSLGSQPVMSYGHGTRRFVVQFRPQKWKRRIHEAKQREKSVYSYFNMLSGLPLDVQQVVSRLGMSIRKFVCVYIWKSLANVFPYRIIYGKGHIFKYREFIWIIWSLHSKSVVYKKSCILNKFWYILDSYKMNGLIII